MAKKYETIQQVATALGIEIVDGYDSRGKSMVLVSKVEELVERLHGPVITLAIDRKAMRYVFMDSEGGLFGLNKSVVFSSCSERFDSVIDELAARATSASPETLEPQKIIQEASLQPSPLW